MRHSSATAAYAEAAGRARAAALAVCGSDVRPWAELGAELGPPPAWTAPVLLERASCNALRFRTNYACVLAAWCAVCAVRHPVSTLCLALVGSVSFDVLLVRRGVVHLVRPDGRLIATLMYPLLHAALGVGSALALAIFGCAGLAFTMLAPPVALAAAHALLRTPPRRGEVEAMAAEIRAGVHDALRGGDAGGADDDEIEGLSAELEPPARSDDMARRVEQIKQKYRPPGSRKKVAVD